MLAYFIALRIGLPRPSWSIVTVYLVSQPSAGASLSRGLYRLTGTFIGAIATVAIVPNFVNEPIVCSVVLACWIGLGLFVSLLDRTPRAYAFVLSGYTTSLIGFPALASPGTVFDIASVRVQEVALGIFSSVVVHRYILPRRLISQFLSKVMAISCDVRRLAGDVLTGSCCNDRYRLALDLLVLRGLETHLPYDPVIVVPHDRTLRLMHDRQVRFLPLLSDLEAQLKAVKTLGMPPDLDHLLGRVCQWLTLGTRDEREAEVRALSHDARSLANADAPAPSGMLAGNIARHLADLIDLIADVEQLAAATCPGMRTPLRLHGEKVPRGYVFHRDVLMAGRAALGATVGIGIGCLIWIWSAWPDGGLAVSVVGVTCALFGNVDAPVPYVRKYLVGSFYGVVISLIYSFVVLPRVFDFYVLVAVLAPVFLFAGSLQARPATAFMALGITLTTPILVGLGPVYGGYFAEAINSGIALFLGIGFAAASMALLQTVSPDVVIDRLVRLGRRDVARLARGIGPGEAAWNGLMVDRIALLLPRLGFSPRSAMGTAEAIVRDVRIGRSSNRLRGCLERGETARNGELRLLLGDLAEYFDKDESSLEVLKRRVDMLIASATLTGDADHDLRNHLIDLRFALSPVLDGQVQA